MLLCPILKISQVVDSFGVFGCCPLFERVTRELRAFAAMLLPLFGVAFVEVTFAPKDLALDCFAALAILLGFELAGITVDSTDRIVCHDCFPPRI